MWEPCLSRDHTGHGHSQWETIFQCNIFSHWLSPYPEWSLLSQLQGSTMPTVRQTYHSSKWNLANFSFNQGVQKFFRPQSMIWGSKSASLYCMRKGLLAVSTSCDSQWLMHKMIKWSSKMIFNFNTLWPSDAIWWHRSVLTLARITACCWWQQAITWTNVDLWSVGSTEICLWAMS